MKEIVDSIVSSAYGSKFEEQFVSESGYAGILFDKKNFKSINGSNFRVGFVDGGNNELFKTTNMALHFVRIYGCVYTDAKIFEARREFYVLVKTVSDGDGLRYVVECYPMIGTPVSSFSFAVDDAKLGGGVFRADISKVVDVVRRVNEINFASLLECDVLVLDGSLRCFFDVEKKEMEKLMSKCASLEISLCSLSKTNNMLTNKGNSVSGLMFANGPSSAWSYHPVAECVGANFFHKAEMYFVKLHAKSEYVFRLEISIGSSYEKVVCGLVGSCRDITFVGYPYGLLIADRFARVSNEEKDYLRLKLKSSFGSRWEDISKFENSLNAHSVLDNM